MLDQDIALKLAIDMHTVHQTYHYKTATIHSLLMLDIDLLEQV